MPWIYPCVLYNTFPIFRIEKYLTIILPTTFWFSMPRIAQHHHVINRTHSCVLPLPPRQHVLLSPFTSKVVIRLFYRNLQFGCFVVVSCIQVLVNYNRRIIASWKGMGGQAWENKLHQDIWDIWCGREKKQQQQQNEHLFVPVFVFFFFFVGLNNI